MILDEMTWRDARDAIGRNAMLIIPAGSIEQHGHHLPLSTDSVTAFELANRVAKQRDAVVAPVLSYTTHSRPSGGGGGEGFPGSIGIPARVMIQLVEAILLDVLRQGYRRIVVLNGHFENIVPVTDALSTVMRSSPNARAILISWTDVVSADDLKVLGFPTPGGFQDWAVEHAATTETSFMKHFRPGLVRNTGSNEGGVSRRATYEVFPLPPALIPPTGMMGDARHANADFGERLATLAVERIIGVLDRELGTAE
jgi:creatinine amidohydrolase